MGLLDFFWTLKDDSAAVRLIVSDSEPTSWAEPLVLQVKRLGRVDLRRMGVDITVFEGRARQRRRQSARGYCNGYPSAQPGRVPSSSQKWPQ